MSWRLRIKWWFEERKARLPGWLLIGWPIFWTLYAGIPDLFDATNFWIETAKTVGGEIGLSATIIDSPWFNLGLFILGVLYLRYVGEVQRPLRHPAWPILGWVVVVVIALTFWSVLVAGYVVITSSQHHQYVRVDKSGEIIEEENFSEYGMRVKRKDIEGQPGYSLRQTEYLLTFEKAPARIRVGTQEGFNEEVEEVNRTERRVRCMRAGAGGSISVECNFTVEAFRK
jgi:hypothetical protein